MHVVVYRTNLYYKVRLCKVTVTLCVTIFISSVALKFIKFLQLIYFSVKANYFKVQANQIHQQQYNKQITPYIEQTHHLR